MRSAYSQQPQFPDLEELQRLQEQRESQREGLEPNRQILRPRPQEELAAEAERPPSALEEFFSEQAGVELEQFGYQVFGKGREVVASQVGAVESNYVLGPGDEIVVELRGQENASYRVEVNREGRVILDRLNPVLAAGRTFGEFKEDLKSKISAAYIASSAFISLGDVRQVEVLVTGEVRDPGRHTLNGLSNAVDALLLAGGIKKTGSLRQVQLIRGNTTRTIDLYTLLTDVAGGIPAGLASGDRIHVPALGPTVAITGSVQRPGIFELGAGERRLQATALVDLAGGVRVRGAYRFSVVKIEPSGQRRLTQLPGIRGQFIEDSEILRVDPLTTQLTGQVTLEGHVATKGLFPVSQASTLRALIGSRSVFDESPYTLFGVVSRRNPVSMFRQLVSFSPLDVLSGTYDLPLQDRDIVYIFSISEVRRLAEIVVETEAEAERSRFFELRRTTEAQRELALDNREQSDEEQQRQRLEQLSRGEGRPTPMTPRDETQREQAEQDTQDLASSLVVADEKAVLGERASEEALEQTAEGDIQPIAELLNVETRLLFEFLAEHRATVAGAVRLPGFYFVVRPTRVIDLLDVAGGLQSTADLGSIEITSTELKMNAGQSTTNRQIIDLDTDGGTVTVQPLDVVRVREVFSDRSEGSVVVSGEVRFPGTFQILRGERLSSVLTRAGGLTDQAYPYGAVFTRVSAAEREAESFERAAREIENQITQFLEDAELGQEELTYLQGFLDQLRNQTPVGRVSIEADPAYLAANPDRDVVLQPGDAITIPRRPNEVTVAGQVLNPSSYQFEPGFDTFDYIELAGGESSAANDDEIFVIYPNGTSHRISGGLFSFDSVNIPPGSVIVVPRDLSPFEFGEFIVEFTQLSSQLAVTAASLAVVANR